MTPGQSAPAASEKAASHRAARGDPDAHPASQCLFFGPDLSRRDLDANTRPRFSRKAHLQIITFDPAILNEKSPAHGEALSWYRVAVRRHAHAFPTDTTLLTTTAPEKKMSWTDIESEPLDYCH